MKSNKVFRVIFSLVLIVGMLASTLNLQPVIAQAPQEELNITGSPFVLYDEGTYHMWYSTDDATLYHASSSEPGSFTNGTAVVLTGEEPTSFANPAVIKEGPLFYMFLYQYGANRRVVMYSSEDGINWSYVTRAYTHLTLPMYAHELDGFEIERVNDVYYLYYSALDGEQVNGANPPIEACTHKIYLATYAGDLADLAGPEIVFDRAQNAPILQADASKGWDSDEVSSPSIVYFDNQFFMWYTGSGADGSEKIGLATSSDGIAWTRGPINPVFDGSNAMVLQHQGRWDTWYQGLTGSHYLAGGVPAGFASPNLTLSGLDEPAAIDVPVETLATVSMPANALAINNPQLKYVIGNTNGTPLTESVTSSFQVADPSDELAEPSEVTPSLVDGRLEYLVPAVSAWTLTASQSLTLEASPTFNTTGDFTLTLSLFDSTGTPPIETASAAAEIEVGDLMNTAPHVYPIDDQTITELETLELAPTTSDPEVPPQILTFSITPATGVGTVDPATGIYSWTPPVGTARTEPYQVTYTACDNGSPSQCGSASFNITVQATSNNPPSFAYPIQDRTISEMTLLGFTVPFLDPDVPPQVLTFTLTPSDIGATVDSIGRFRWTPTEAQGPETYFFTIEICDNFSPPACVSDSFNVSVMEVNLPPVLDPLQDQNIPPEVEYSFTATATDPDLPAQSLVFSLGTSAPINATIDPASGVFSWTPTAAQANANYTFDVCVSDGPLSHCLSMTLSVGVENLPPTLYPISDATIPENVEYSFTARATDEPGSVLTFSLENAPTGAVINPTSGIFTWTPTEEQGPGVYPFTVKVCDDGVPIKCATQTVTLTVEEVNLPPTLYPIEDTTIPEMVAYSFTASATDPDDPDLNFTLENAPAGAVIDASTGLFSWTPTEAQGPGFYTFTVKVCDDFTPPACDTEEVTLTVSEVNVAPQIEPFEYVTIPELVLYQKTHTATDPDIPVQTLTWSISPNSPTGATIDPATGVFSWTPTEEQGPGDYSFSICVYDTVIFTCANNVITVTEVNLLPDLYPIDDETIPEMVEYNFTASATDADSTTLTFSLVDAPTGAQIDPATGLFSWTPSEAQGPGVYTFTVQVCDDFDPAGCDTDAVTLTVTEVNLPPVLDPIEDAIIWEGQDFTFTATASDPDLPAQPLTFSLGSTAPTGAAIDSTTGVFTWTPTVDQGPDVYNFDVCVSDGIVSDCQSITITVNEGNLPPTLYPIQDATIPEMALYSFTAEADDPNLPAQTLTFSLQNAPTGATIDPTTGFFSWTPTEAQGPNTYTFTVQVCDDQTPPLCDSQEVTLTVTEVNLPPVLAAIGNKTVAEMVLLSFTASATDPDIPIQTLTFSVNGAPSGAQIDPATGAFSWTPTEAQGPGNYTFDVCVSDGALNDCETITITVSEVNLEPILGTIPNATIPELEPFTFTATATDPDLPAQALTFSLLNAPVGANIGATSGVFTWTPTEAQGPGVYTFTVQVCDPATPPACDTQAVTLTVTEVATAPAITPIGNLSVLEMELLSYQIIVTDPDLPANTFQFSLRQGPTGMSLDSNTGLLTWTPTEMQGFGVYTVKAEVCDNTNLCYEETFTVTVYEVNLAPSIAPIEDVTIPEEVRFTYQVLGSDPDIPAQVLTYSLVDAPDGADIGSLTGNFRWTPSEAQGPGTYTVIVRVCDNYTQPLCALETFVITVEEVPVAPIAVDDAYTMDENTTLTVAAPGVLANDRDPDSTILVVLQQGEVSVGTLILNDDGSFEYTPPANYYGEVTFRYKIVDGSGMFSNIATVTITVLNTGGEVYLPLIFR